METLTIGQLARAVGVAVSTVRFYERKGILKAEFRTGGNYRGYGVESLKRLRFIRFAKGTGFSLADISELLALAKTEGLPCGDIESLLKGRLAEVRGKIEELVQVERTLKKAMRDCCRGTEKDLCEEVSRLRNGKPCRDSCDCGKCNGSGTGT